MGGRPDQAAPAAGLRGASPRHACGLGRHFRCPPCRRQHGQHRRARLLPRRAHSDVSDDGLRQIIREHRQHGFDVYLALAFEAFEAYAAARPVQRWQLGDPGAADTGVPRDPERPAILPEFWPWRPSHPDHDRFVEQFWATYTEQAVHFAGIAQEEGVRMYSLGTETDRLFRTRSGDEYWTNDFGRELVALVDSVRAVYGGLLTYDMHYSAVSEDLFAPGSRHLWEDLDLDVVGVSAWFSLAESPPSRGHERRQLAASLRADSSGPHPAPRGREYRPTGRLSGIRDRGRRRLPRESGGHYS